MCVIVVFSEDGEAFSVTALDGTETLWQESVKKQDVLEILRAVESVCVDRMRCSWWCRKRQWCVG